MLIDASSADDSNSQTGQLSFSWTINDNGFTMIEGIDSPVLEFTTPNTGGNYTIDLVISDGYSDGSLPVSFNIDVIDCISFNAFVFSASLLVALTSILS